MAGSGDVTTRRDCEALDAADPLGEIRARFAPGDAHTLYFDANSVGAMPLAAPRQLDRLIGEWQHLRRRGWSESDWLAAPQRLGAKLAPVLGAAPDEVIVCDTTSINLFKALAAAMQLRPGRSRIVSEAATFPTDLYVAQGLAGLRDGLKLHLLEEGDAIEPAIDGSTVALYLSFVDYRSARRHDIHALTKAAHARGALVIWDLSHGAGAVACDLDAADVDLAVGCGYKYLCGGPGGPAYIFAARRLHDSIRPALAGWMGHAATFKFTTDYEPAPGMARFLVATPPVIANAVFEAALDIWASVDPQAVFCKHDALGDLLGALVDRGVAGPGVSVASPRAAARRGGFVALKHAGGAAVVAALADAGVVASFRAPDSLRFGLSALYHRHVDIWDAAERLGDILRRDAWRAPKYQQAKAI
jgi:kynureninase